MVVGYRMVGESKKVVEISVHLNLQEDIGLILLKISCSVINITNINSTWFLMMVIFSVSVLLWKNPPLPVLMIGMYVELSQNPTTQVM